MMTARGPVLARDVIVANNGYTGGITPWLQRRVIPIGSYMVPGPFGVVLPLARQSAGVGGVLRAAFDCMVGLSSSGIWLT